MKYWQWKPIFNQSLLIFTFPLINTSCGIYGADFLWICRKFSLFIVVEINNILLWYENINVVEKAITWPCLFSRLVEWSLPLMGHFVDKEIHGLRFHRKETKGQRLYMLYTHYNLWAHNYLLSLQNCCNFLALNWTYPKGSLKWNDKPLLPVSVLPALKIENSQVRHFPGFFFEENDNKESILSPVKKSWKEKERKSTSFLYLQPPHHITFIF